MSVSSRKNNINMLIPLILSVLIVISCSNTSPEVEKFQQADNQKLIEILQNGNLKERRKVSTLLKNNVKTENKQAFIVSLSSDEDDIVAANCAIALAKIGDADSIKVLAESIQSFSGKRAESCACALVSQGINGKIIKTVEEIIVKKPIMLGVFTDAIKTINNDIVLGFYNKILADYEKYSTKIIATIIDNIGYICAKQSLPVLYEIYYHTKSSELRAKAEHAIDCYSDKVKSDYAYIYDEIITRNTKVREEELRKKQITITRRLEKLKPPIPYLEMSKNIETQRVIQVKELELIKDYATIGHPGGFNKQVNEGELLAIKVHIENVTGLKFKQLSGYCYSYSKYVQVLNRRIIFQKINALETKSSVNSLMLLVSPDVKPNEKIELFFQFGESKQGERDFVIYSKAEIVIEPLPLGPFTFEVSNFDDDQWGFSEGNGDGILQWGERCEIEILIRNTGKLNVEGAQLEVISLNPQARLNKSRINLGGILADDEEGNSVIIDFNLSSDYEGKYDMFMLLKLNIIEEKKIIGSWIQKLLVTVGEKTPKLVGRVYSYKPFDMLKLIDIFVVKQNNSDAQELYLFNTEIEYLDAKSSLILEME
ncbi:MAG: HEAT repeat domain-containing protein [Planctomycetes bacterium]|nr:HEAT repeat domain-containing protein [Planctomycetota bacterium]